MNPPHKQQNAPSAAAWNQKNITFHTTKESQEPTLTKNHSLRKDEDPKWTNLFTAIAISSATLPQDPHDFSTPATPRQDNDGCSTDDHHFDMSDKKTNIQR